MEARVWHSSGDISKLLMVILSLRLKTKESVCAERVTEISHICPPIEVAFCIRL